MNNKKKQATLNKRIIILYSMLCLFGGVIIGLILAWIIMDYSLAHLLGSLRIENFVMDINETEMVNAIMPYVQ